MPAHIKRPLTLLVIASLFFVATGCANDQKVMAVADKMHTGLEPAVMHDPELSAYLQKIGDRIIETAMIMDKEGYGPKSHKSSDDNAWMFSNNMHFYFVNSYYPIPQDPEVTIATSQHGLTFAAVIAHENIVATQFHLEKSGAAGLKLLDNFCRLKA